MNKTIGTLFSGFGGVDIGARAVGIQSVWGIEYDPAIAEIGNFNLGNHIRVANILDCNPSDFEQPDILHASPPCTCASNANNSAELNEDGQKESSLDIALAEKVIEFITVLKPNIFTLENVYAYRLFQSWRGGKKTKGVQQALYDAGYWLHMDHVNCADYAVPQTRKRMIVRAVRDSFVPYMPEPVSWIGWYESIEDLLPGLPESEFAPWQVDRLPDELKTMLVAQGKYDNKLVVSNKNDPAFTVTANSNQTGVRAFLVNGANTYGDGISYQDEPAKTIGANEHGTKAFIIQVQGEGGDGVRWHDEPMATITSAHSSEKYRAFIVDCQDAGSINDGERGLTIRHGEQPMFTVTSTQLPKRPPRAYLSQGRVVSMTPRCLARFQSFPDTYVLPESKTLAAKGIGNAVPPLLMQRIYEGLITAN